jgi:GMP synthase-like glutamine amidotransferase
MEVVAVIHGADCGPELLADVVAERGDTLVEWWIEEQGAPPRVCDAAIVLGGHQNVGEEDRYPWLEDEYAALRGWVESGTPVFGVCLGGQTLAHAFGGSVRKLDAQLAGFYETVLTPAGIADPVLGALPERFEVLNGNAYSFSVPPGGVALADGPVPQAFRVGSAAWGVQFHPELRRFNIASWFEHDPELARRLEGDRSELDAKFEAWRPLGARLFSAFLDAAARRIRRVNEDDLKRFQEAGTESEVPAGHVLIERGQWGSGIYVILEGIVVVEAPEGTRELGAGSVVGERALLSEDGLRTARVRATTPVRVLAVDRAEFDRLCESDPELPTRIAAPSG